MKLTINGQEREDISAATLQQLLDILEITSGRVAVEVNMHIVKKADYDRCELKDGDVIEIVNFVGGG